MGLSVKAAWGVHRVGHAADFLPGLLEDRRSVAAVVLTFLFAFRVGTTGTLLPQYLTFRGRAVVAHPRVLKQANGDHKEMPEPRELTTPAGLAPAEDWSPFSGTSVWGLKLPHPVSRGR